MTNVLIAISVLIIAALVAMYSPMLGGIIAMLPTKAIGYAIILSGKSDISSIRDGIMGMIYGTVFMTLPVLALLYLWANR